MKKMKRGLKFSQTKAMLMNLKPRKMVPIMKKNRKMRKNQRKRNKPPLRDSRT
jgi:hypothetical protein